MHVFINSIECVFFKFVKFINNIIMPRRTIQESKLQYFGHLIRGNGKQKILVEGKIEGTRRRGKQRRIWTSDVADWCGLSYTKYVRMAENRKEWSSMAANLLSRRWHPL